LIAATGHTWTEVRDDWDFPRVNAWVEFTADHPPLHAMVAAYLGYKPGTAAAQQEQRLEGEEAAAFLMSMPGFAHK
jgi:hypothetical protein